MSTVVNKKVKLDLTCLDGNSFALIAAFARQARREGWKSAEIDAVVDDCYSGDYDHCLQTLIAHTE